MKVVTTKGNNYKTKPQPTKDMKKENLFSITFILTIIITRIYLYFYPLANPIIAGLKIKHWMIGLLIILIYFIISYFKEDNVIIVIFGMGLGLFVDELTYLLTGGKTHADNYTTLTILGTIIFAVVILLCKKYIFQFIPLKEKKVKK